MTALRNFVNQHPRLASWVGLSMGMLILLLWAAADVPLLSTQLLALVVATVVLAGLCVWIISWE